MNLREAAQQALEALELAGMSHDVMLMSDPPQDAWKARGVNWKLAEAMNALRAALADTQDRDEIEALRASLREHMAEIHRLRAAGRQALDAMDYTRWAVADQASNEDVAAHDKSMNNLRPALAEKAMQQLTDVQQEIENGANTVQSPGGIYSRVFDSGDRNVEAVTNCHDKEGDKLSPPLNVPETNFGNMAQAVDSTEADHSPDATKMMASVREDRTVEPVGYGVFEDGNLHDSFRLEHEAKLFAALKGEHAEVHALYIAPSKREPLTEQELEPIRRRMMMEAYNAADDCDFERYNALKVMANDVLDMLLGVRND